MSLARASLWYYRRRHVVTAAAVAVAVSVLAGSWLVGASVEASLRELALQRLGATDLAIETPTTFAGRLGAAMAIAAPDTIAGTASLIAVTGTVSHAATGRVATHVRIYGVDESFWRFHGVSPVTLTGSETAISEALARALGVADGDALSILVHAPADVPLSTLAGRRDEIGTRVTVTTVRTLGSSRLGEFALQPEAGPIAAVFVPLSLLQRELKIPGRVNTILVQQARRTAESNPGRPPIDAVQRAWLAGAALPDFGVRIRRVPGDRVMALEGLGGYIDPAVATRVQGTLSRLQRPSVPALTYLVTAIRVGDRSIPYSAVSAIDIDAYNRLSVPAGPPAPGADEMSTGDPLVRGSLEIRVGRGGARVGRVQVTEAERRSPRPGSPERPSPATDPEAVSSSEGPVWLNEWAVADLGARAGDAVHLEYLVWSDRDGLDRRQATFTMQGVVPMMRVGGDRTLTPDFPGITDAGDLTAWRTAFPVDDSQVRPLDEAYWDRWRTAPKAFVPLEIGQRLWGSRFGDVSSIRFALRDADIVAAAVREEVSSRISLRAVRNETLAATIGASRVGWYFAVLGLGLVAAALLIVYWSVMLGIEQRTREAGLLTAVGFPISQVRRGFFTGGLVVLFAGTMLGLAGAAGYAALILHGLRTWWLDAVETTSLRLALDPLALIAGAAAGAVPALIVMWVATGAVMRLSPRAALAGSPVDANGPARSWRRCFIAGVALAILAGALVLAAESDVIRGDLGFIAAGCALLVSGLLLLAAWLRWRAAESTTPVRSLWSLAITHAAWHPRRTVLAVAVIACTMCMLTTVAIIGRDVMPSSQAREGATGGFVLLAESALPLMHDPNTPAGQAALGLEPEAWRDVRVTRLRLRPGDDVSWHALYQPRNPRIAGVTPADLEGRFTFANAGATVPGASSWQLLDQAAADGVVPAIVDSKTLIHALRLGIGDTFAFAPDGVTPVRFRVVAALADSVLPSAIVVSEGAFVRLFPSDEGYRIWLIDAPESRVSELATTIAERLTPLGVEVVDARDRLASQRRAMHAYLDAWAALGSLGLVLATLGLGTGLARNLLGRQREWGWLRVAGYQPGHLRRLVIMEGAIIVAAGLLIGAAAAAVAAAPVVVSDIRSLPLRELALVLTAIAGAAVTASLLAVRMVTARTAREGLRAE